MRRFFDTNVLVYSRDRSEPGKRDLAHVLIENAIADDSFVVSSQVLLEFYVTMQRRNLLGPAQALQLVRLWSDHDTVSNTSDLLLRGVELHQEHSLSIWDALVVQAAIDAWCDVLLTEDLQHGRRFGEVIVENPFLEAHAAREPRRKRFLRERFRGK